MESKKKWSNERWNSFLASRPILSAIFKGEITNEQLSDKQIKKMLEEEIYSEGTMIIDGIETKVENVNVTGLDLLRNGMNRDIVRRISNQMNLRPYYKLSAKIKEMKEESKKYSNVEPIFNFEVVEKAINDWNPMGILAYSDPECTKCINPDEYYAEIQDIVKCASKVDTIDETILANIIHDVFVKWFFENEDFSFDKCLPIAKKILDNSKIE